MRKRPQQFQFLVKHFILADNQNGLKQKLVFNTDLWNSFWIKISSEVFLIKETKSKAFFSESHCKTGASPFVFRWKGQKCQSSSSPSSAPLLRLLQNLITTTATSELYFSAYFDTQLLVSDFKILIEVIKQLTGTMFQAFKKGQQVVFGGFCVFCFGR